jgi:hypothetical protein
MTMHEGLVKGKGFRDEIRRVTREQRRNTGMYYTPVAIARYMVRKVIELSNVFSQHGKKVSSVFDPSCGSGVFLVEMLHQLFGTGRDASPHENRELSIHGIDIDEVAVREATISIDRVVNALGIPPHVVSVAISRGNAIEEPMVKYFPKVVEAGGFDIIIGNPPYIPWSRISPEGRVMLDGGQYLGMNYACRPNHADAQPNYYLFFIVHAASNINENGIISFLLPQEWLYHERAIDFRRFLLDHFRQIDVYLFPPDAKIFSQRGASAGTTSMILMLRKHGTPSIRMHRIDDLDTTILADSPLVPHVFQMTELSFDAARDNAWAIVDEQANAIKDHVLQQPLAMFDDIKAFAVHGGFQPPIVLARKFEIDAEHYAQLDVHERSHVFPLVHDACEIQRYVIVQHEPRYWVIANHISSEGELETEYPKLHAMLKLRLDTSIPGWWKFPNVRNFDLIAKTAEKILAPRTSARPSFALDDRRSVFKGTNTMIIPKKKLNARYVVGVLNSKLAAFWQSSFGSGYHGGIVKKMEPSKARKTLMPVKIPAANESREIAILVGTMIDNMKKEGNSTQAETLQYQIDELVYKLYGIPADMQDIIETRLAAGDRHG